MIIIPMGVSGCGKTTVGRLLADWLGWSFYDGDEFHSPTNIQKMSRGIPLTDKDRESWLSTLAALIQEHLSADQSIILACSALKQIYRDRLCIDHKATYLVHLKGSYNLILQRMQLRSGHYMLPKMLASQFAALEEPRDALTVDIRLSPEQIVALIIKRVGRNQIPN